MVTHTDRQIRRADAIPRLLLEKLLDDPVLQRVKGDHCKTPARLEQIPGLDKRGFQHLDFPVDRNPDRLKRLCCRMDPSPTASTNCPFHDRSELGVCFDRCLCTAISN